MKAQVNTITALLKRPDTTYYIPVYQRYYEWSEDECTKLFVDLEQIAKTGKKHFIGTITCVPNEVASESVFSIVDGQQRMTSVILLMRAIYDSTYDPILQKRIRNSFFFNFDYDIGETKVKLKQVDTDQHVFEKLLLQNDFDEEKYDESEKLTCIYQNYLIFHELINQSDVELKKLYDAVFRLEVIEIELEDENPQQVFESMNSTGKPLSNTDLLRNYILMNYPEKKQTYLHKHFWLEIEKYTGRDELENFISLYLIMKRKNNQIILNKKKAKISTKNLYDAYKLFLNGKDIEVFLSDVLRYARIYRHLTDAALEPLVGIRELGCEPAMIFLMYLYHLYEQKQMAITDFSDSTKLVESFILRSKIIKGKQSDQFFSLCISNFEKSSEQSITGKTADALTAGNGSYQFPDNTEFRHALTASNLYQEYKQPFIRYILFKLEQARTKEIVSQPGATIEHILPQNSDQWKDLDDECLEHVHQIGNLTLTKENSELSNKTFEEKKKKYADSNFIITREISKYEKWNSETIVKRSKEIAALATDIWPYPVINSHERNIKAYMSKEAESLYHGLMNCIKESVLDVEERVNKNFITLYTKGKAFVSIIPLTDALYVTFYSNGMVSDGITDISNIGHFGIGNRRIRIENENDLYSFVSVLKDLV